MKKIDLPARSLPLIKATVLVTFCAWNVSASFGQQLNSKKSPHVIYGEDNRKDLYEAQSEDLRNLAESTVALIENTSLSQQASGFFKISGSKYGPSMGLCKTEKFYTQPAAAFCSGSLIAPNLIMTAGHCIKDVVDCKKAKFIFGFALEKADVVTTLIPPEDVAECKKIVSRSLDESTQNDYAIIELKKPITHRKPLKLSKTNPSVGTPLVVIGHPSGLPVKIADGANVRSANVGSPFFVGNLDTYGGNSGSAVFNQKTGLIEGILVRGENDFETRNGCQVSYVCTNNDCRGEDVTKSSEVFRALAAAGISLDKPDRPGPRPTASPTATATQKPPRPTPTPTATATQNPPRPLPTVTPKPPRPRQTATPRPTNRPRRPRTTNPWDN
ncbi:MAG: serine protease [Bacteriovoracaceae bacterium]|nr:serine protease [Bacteriovoracaceae bacterium]